jgi:hypothetical protein
MAVGSEGTAHAVTMALRPAMRSCAAGKTLWTTITSHIQPHLCALGALADLLLFNLLHMELPVLQGGHPLAPQPACSSCSAVSWRAS